MSSSSSLFENQMFARCFGWSIKLWGSPCPEGNFSGALIAGGLSGSGHFSIRRSGIACVSISPTLSSVTGRHPTASGSGFPTPLACWAVLRKRSPCIWLGKDSDMARNYAHVSQASSKLNLMEYVMALAPTVAATISHLGNVQPIG